MICEGQTVLEIMAGTDVYPGKTTWGKRVGYMRPRNVLELGTGQGASGADVMSALCAGSVFTTINYDYPGGYRFGEQLDPWLGDARLVILIADTIDPATVLAVRPGVDLLFIDSHHEAWAAATELQQFQSILEDGAIVVVDDLSHNDMTTFWASVPYEKVGERDQGVFRYDASRPYTNEFKRGRTPKEESEAGSR